ncbi:MAG TPA: VOC family protein [Pirellulaceae bacterium]
MTLAIFETCLYVTDLPSATRFYRDVMGLELVREGESLMSTFRCANSYLLLFNPEEARAADRLAPSHGCRGEGHVAFHVEQDELPVWRDRLARHGVPIEKEVTWPRGGVSVYFRDPSGNILELAPASVWFS